MKKLVLVFCLVLALASVALAEFAGGARLAAMGNAGTALVDDLSSAYYNPAGLMASGTRALKMKVSAGAAMTGMNEVLATFSKASNLNSFMADNLTKAIDVNGSAGGFVGLELGKIGFSVFSDNSSLSASKIANTMNGSATANLNYDIALTLGTTLNIPILPLGFLDVGANIKQVNRLVSSTVITGFALPATTGTATYSEISGSGYGLDLGAKTGLDLPIAPITVGFVIKDLMENLNTTTTGRTDTINIDGSTTAGSPTKTTTTNGIASTWVLGAATTLPGLGTTLALDYTSTMGNAETRLGIEHPIVPYFLKGRVGLISGTNTSKTTLGLGLDFLGSLNVAYIIDGKNSQNNNLVLDFILGL